MVGTPSIKSQDGKRWIRLDESPSVTAIDEWLSELGCQKKAVGKTVQGKDITLYWMDYYYNAEEKGSFSLSEKQHEQPGDPPSPKNFLFLSLVHGNEPMGLTALLMGAKELQKSNAVAAKNKDIQSELSSARVYFLPVVNVDAYELNLSQGEGGFRGCQRGNLANTCVLDENGMTMASNSLLNRTLVTPPCGGWEFYEQLLREKNNVVAFTGGVDLNRNFPTYFEESKEKCSYNYGGPRPLSEPETQAIAQVVEQYNITHAMSMHGRSDPQRPPLLIHPFTSTRSFDSMDPIDAQDFRRSSWALNAAVNKYYITGTAQEAILYTAGGTTIDWMYSNFHVMGFVLEVVPPCEYRWCRGRKVYQRARTHATTINNFVTLITTHQVMVGNRYFDPEDWYLDRDEVGPVAILVFLVSAIAYYVMKKRRHHCRLFLHRFGCCGSGKDKDESTEEERIELVPSSASIL